MKDRLIELLDDAKVEVIEHYPDGTPCMSYTKKAVDRKVIYKLAEFLLANGVIVPPCKVGDKVYCVFEDDVIEDEIILIEATQSAIYLSTCTERYMWINGYLYSEMLDQKLYITKEEAEQALKGGEV